jgi:alpha-L-fucosidase 2
MSLSRRRFVKLAGAAAGAARLENARAWARAALGAASKTGTTGKDLSIWFEQAAGQWADALPVGNGRLGAMVFGGVKSERIALNEDTLWSGFPRDWNNPDAKAHLPTVRKMVLEDKDYQAADQECRKMQGPFNQAYEPLGDLLLEFDHGGEAASYRRSLDLDSAVAEVAYQVDGSRYRREVFASAPDQLIFVRLTSSRRGGLNLTAKLASQLQSKSEASAPEAGPTITLTGKAPSESRPNYLRVADPIQYSSEAGRGMYFAAVLRAQVADGSVTAAPDGSLRVEKATSALLAVGAATGYRGYAVAPDTPLSEVVAAARKPVEALHLANPIASDAYDRLRQRHLDDHRKLFRRVVLDLGATAKSVSTPTDKRIADFPANPDPALLALYFNFGRYLLITSSPPGTQPANLQGIWNAQLRTRRHAISPNAPCR